MADDSASAGASRLGLSYPTTVLVLVSIGWIVIQTGRYLLPPLAPAIRPAFGIDNAGFGLALSLLWAVYAISQFPAGLASDDLGYRTTLVGSIALAGVAFGAFALASVYGLWLALLVVIGVCTGVFLISSRALLSELYGADRGRALGIHSAAGDIAGVIAPLLATVVLAATIWTAPFVGLLVVAFFGVVGLHVIVRGEYTVRRPAVGETGRAAVSAVHSWDLLVVTVVYGLYVFATQGTAAFVPTYLVEVQELSIGAANTVLSLFFLMGVVAKPLAGWASDRVGRRLLTVTALVVGGVALPVATLLSGLASAGAILLFAASVRFFPTPTQAYLFDRFEAATSGSSFGLLRSGYILVGSTGPAAVGAGSEAVGFGPTLSAVGATLIVAASVLALMMREA
jgi:MFS family permease